jgi:hypothetical protein
VTLQVLTTRPTVYPTIGIDPGQQWIGIAVRIDDACLDAVTLRRPVASGTGDRDRARYQADQAWAARVLDTVEYLLDRHQQAGAAAAARWEVDYSVTPWRVAVEGVNLTQPFHQGQRLPAGHRAKLLWGMLQTTVPYAAVIGHFPAAVIVSPADRRRQETRDQDRLPKELSGHRPWRFGSNEHPKGDRVHERAAWSVAGAAQHARPLSLRREEVEI